MVKKYSKQDQKIIKDLLNTLHDHHQTLNGGSAFTDFLHGFTVPFKQFAGLIPGVSKILQPIAESIDSMIPGHRYETMSDVMSGKYIKGTGKGKPRKIRIPKLKINNIEDPSKKDKLYTETTKQLIEDEKQLNMKRGRGRPRGSKNKPTK